MNKTLLCRLLLALCLLLFVAYARQTTPSQVREVPEDGDVPTHGGIVGSFRIVGCTPSQTALSITATKTGSSQRIMPSGFSMTKDDREITTAHFSFGDLLPGGYKVTAYISDLSCSPGRWLRGGPVSWPTINLRTNPWPRVTLLYVTRETETTVDMGFLLPSLNSLLLKNPQPSIRLDNHGPEHDGSRWLRDGSWVEYTELWKIPATTKKITFSIPEVREELADGNLGVFKYYVNNVDGVPPGPGEQAIDWDSAQYKIRLMWKLEDSGTEVKGYYRSTLTGLSDDAAPDVNLTGPLSVKATLVPSYGYWDGRVTFSVESTEFQAREIQAGGICNLADALCKWLVPYRREIRNAVKDTLASLLTDHKVNEFVGNSMEDLINGGLFVECSAQPCGSFVTEMRKEGGQIKVKWVATHFQWPSGSSQPSEPNLRCKKQCRTTQKCCELSDDGSCCLCWPKAAPCP